MINPIPLQTPLSDKVVEGLHTGDMVALSGIVYGARDAAHQRMMQALDAGENLPFEPLGQVIFYVGPTPAPPGRPIGSAGPTTAGRMDAYTPRLIELGLKGMIGKGARGKEVIEACVKYKAVYFAGIGGAGALASQHVVSAEVIAWEDLGPEAVRALVLKEFPLVVVNDVYGRDLYQEGRQKYAVSR